MLGLDAATLLAAIGLLVGGGYALWKDMTGKIDAAEARVSGSADEAAKEHEKEHDRMNARLDNLESSRVTREEHRIEMQAITRAMEAFALALRESTATMTQRIDTVLFEVGRQRHGKTD